MSDKEITDDELNKIINNLNNEVKLTVEELNLISKNKGKLYLFSILKEYQFRKAQYS